MFSVLVEPRIKAFIERTAQKNSVPPANVTVTYTLANGLQVRIAKMGTVVTENVQGYEI